MTGARVALDTNVAIQILKGNQRVSGKFRAEDEVALPVTLARELLFGAATCLEHDLVLVTSDAHFSRCPGLKTEDGLNPETSP